MQFGEFNAVTIFLGIFVHDDVFAELDLAALVPSDEVAQYGLGVIRARQRGNGRIDTEAVRRIGGARLFDDADASIPLRLLSSETFPSGVLYTVYGPDLSPPTGGYEDAVAALPE